MSNERKKKDDADMDEPTVEIRDEIDRDDDDRSALIAREAEPEELDDVDILEEIDLDQLELDLDLDEVDHPKA
jgi:hypothetical protein